MLKCIDRIKPYWLQCIVGYTLGFIVIFGGIPAIGIAAAFLLSDGDPRPYTTCVETTNNIVCGREVRY